MKKISRVQVVLYGICAGIWSMKTVLEIYEKTYLNSMSMFILGMACTAAWLAIFYNAVRKYRAEKEN